MAETESETVTESYQEADEGETNALEKYFRQEWKKRRGNKTADAGDEEGSVYPGISPAGVHGGSVL